VETQAKLNQKGITLIELLVALIISGIAIAGIYRLFITQTTAYTVQDQVAEVQQNVRSGMEILLRDLRMTGFDDDASPAITIANPVAFPLSDNAITLSYEYYDRNLFQYQRHTVTYNLNALNAAILERQLTVNNVAQPLERVLENVDSLIFSYGVDQNNDGTMDDQNGDNIIDNNDWLPAAGAGTGKVIAIRVTLTTRPEQVNPQDDRFRMVTPRTLTSAITLRNLSKPI